MKFISEQGLIPGSICDFFLFEFQKVVENIYMSCKFFPVKAGSSACQDCIFAWNRFDRYERRRIYQYAIISKLMK